LIGYGQKTTMKRILLSLWKVKGKIALENRLGFKAQIEDLRLKCDILGRDPKNKSTGRSHQDA